MCFLNCKYSSITAHISNNVLVMKTKSLVAAWHVIWSTWNSINYIYLHEHDTVLLKLLFVRAVTRYAAIWTQRGTGAWKNGNRHPGWGVAEIQKRSPPTTVGDAADMQLPCYQTRESPSSGKCSIFCYRLTYISKMCTIT